MRGGEHLVRRRHRADDDEHLDAFVPLLQIREEDGSGGHCGVEGGETGAHPEQEHGYHDGDDFREFQYFVGWR